MADIAAENKQGEQRSVALDPTSDTQPARSRKKVWLERLILCIALFFPLFLATLDTSTFLILLSDT